MFPRECVEPDNKDSRTYPYHGISAATEEPELGIRRTPSGMHALGKVEYFLLRLLVTSIALVVRRQRV